MRHQHLIAECKLMPIEIKALIHQVNSYAQSCKSANNKRSTRMAQLGKPFNDDFRQADHLLAVCRKAHELGWPVALFDSEPINKKFRFGNEPDCYALIAADGSQIMPDRHKPFVFAFIQVGCASIVYGRPEQPSQVEPWQQLKRACLIGEESLFDDFTGELKTPHELTNRRDLMEIELLAEVSQMARAVGLQPVLIADGSLVPFALLTSRNLSGQESEELLGAFKAALHTMHACGAWVCGYIDRPNSKSVARACALNGLLPEEITQEILQESDPGSVFDRHLLERVLLPKQRTALFNPAWKVNAPEYLGMHAMRACYANFGTPAQPIIARIETPQWCADKVDILCAILDRHVHLGMGYPFILTAAHKESVLSKEDQETVEQAIEQAMLEMNILGRPSFKQMAKSRI